MRLVREIAVEVLGEEKAAGIWSRIDLIGDIAVIKKPFHGDVSIGDLRLIAEVLVGKLPYVKSVWLAVSPVEGRYKVRRFIHLAGEPRSETVYKEHGCVFKLDITRVFATPRLSYERIRIARLVRTGEVVVNMFAGAGLYSIIIARHSKPRMVHSIDINEDAYKYMVENIRLNKVEDRVTAYLGDAREVIESRLTGIADRVLMPLPELALEYLGYAVASLRGEGYIHVYLHVTVPKGLNPLELASTIVEDKLDSLGVTYRISGSRKVRPVGPRTYQVVVDVRVGGDG